MPEQNQAKNMTAGCMTALVILMILIGAYSILPKPAAKKVSSVPTARTGIDSTLFYGKVKEAVDAMNKDSVMFSGFKTNVVGECGFVDLTFASVSSYMYAPSALLQDVAARVGRAMELAAMASRYSGSSAVYAETVFYSPGGAEVMSRSLYGNIKIK